MTAAREAVQFSRLNDEVGGAAGFAPETHFAAALLVHGRIS